MRGYHLSNAQAGRAPATHEGSDPMSFDNEPDVTPDTNPDGACADTTPGQTAPAQPVAAPATGPEPSEPAPAPQPEPTPTASPAPSEPAPAEKPIESASATSSSEANHSGPGAYIAFAVVVVLLCGLASLAANALGNLTAEIGETVVDQIENGSDQDDDWDWGFSAGRDEIDPDDDFTGEVSYESAIDYSYDVLWERASDYVYASDYDNADAKVTEAVKALCELDDDASDELFDRFYDAWGEYDDAPGKMAEAKGIANAAKAAIEAYKIPDGIGAEAKRDLEDARDALAERWEHVAKLCDELSVSGKKDADDLSAIDTEASDLASKAGGLLDDALTDSASNR